MKIQTTARIESLTINGESWKLDHGETIDLEFSAIDAGGGFKDPILDFSFSIEKPEAVDVDKKEKEIAVKLSDPDRRKNKTNFTYKGILKAKNDNLIEVNGRLKDDQMTRELIGFILNRLQ